MKFLRFLFKLSLIMIWLDARSQIGKKCLIYRNTYNDSNLIIRSTLIGWQEYDLKSRLKLQAIIAPNQYDTCITRYKYNSKGLITKSVVNCSKDDIIEVKVYSYNIKKDGTIESKIELQEKPFFEKKITQYFAGGYNILTFDKNGSQYYKYKDIQLANTNSEPLLIASLNEKGDTLMSHSFIYYLINDTCKVRNNFLFYVAPFKKSQEIDVIFRDKKNGNEVIDFYKNDSLVGSSVKNGKNGKILNEYYINRVTNSITSNKTYRYVGTHIFITEYNGDIKKVSEHVGNKLLSEEFYFVDKLKYSLSYVYQPAN